MTKPAAEPWYATPERYRLSGGRIINTRGGMWLYRAIPMQPVEDARTPDHMMQAATPILEAAMGLAKLATTTSARRAVNSRSYREVHFHEVSIPQRFSPPAGAKNAAHLMDDFGGMQTIRRVSLMGVRIKDSILRKDRNPLKGAIESVAESLATRSVPIEDYRADYELIDGILSRAGLQVPTDEELDLASAWWNYGRNPDVPHLVHSGHLHFFDSAESAKVGERSNDDECADWKIRGQVPITFASVPKLELNWDEVTNPRTLWVSDLIGAEARAISIRGFIEPEKVTAGELRRHRDQYEADIRERVAQGKRSKAEQEAAAQMLNQVHDLYSTSGGMPTLTSARVTVALDGVIDDLASVMQGSVAQLGSLAFRQRAAMAEQMLASDDRANPVTHDLPIQTVACAGLPSLSTVGDAEGALLGFSEYDRQPAYVSPSAVSDEDSLPFMLVAGATGSGKSMAVLALARQWAKIKNRRGEFTPVVVVDPKQYNDDDGSGAEGFGTSVRAYGGQVYSLDQLASADGVFDPMRTTGEGVELAAAMLGDIRPWGSRGADFETDLLVALRAGAERGATCIGQALELARAAGLASDELVDPVLKLMDASPSFRAIFGRDPQGPTLRTAQGLTLIEVGTQPLPLPEPGEANPTLVKRINQWVLRMMVYGSAAAVSGRQGVVILDEAWQFVQGVSGAAEVQRLGRMARSMQVLPVMASQRVSDFVDANLSGYVSRGLILSLDRGQGTLPDGSVDDGQAGAALDLFKIARTEERLDRLAARQFKEGGREPNWNSLKALRDPATGNIIRGSVALYVDMSGRVVPVEVTIPAEFLRQISTSAGDVEKRRVVTGGDVAGEGISPTGVGVSAPEVSRLTPSGLRPLV